MTETIMEQEASSSGRYTLLLLLPLHQSTRMAKELSSMIVKITSSVDQHSYVIGGSSVIRRDLPSKWFISQNRLHHPPPLLPRIQEKNNADPSFSCGVFRILHVLSDSPRLSSPMPASSSSLSPIPQTTATTLLASPNQVLSLSPQPALDSARLCNLA